MYRERIDAEIASAMKETRTLDLAVWRSIKTEFKKFETAAAGNILTDEKELQILSKMVLQRKDSIEQYKQANREDLADVEERELLVLSSLLPKEPTQEDIESVITEMFVDGEKPSMKDMKRVMETVKAKFPTVNGGVVSKIFREKYI